VSVRRVVLYPLLKLFEFFDLLRRDNNLHGCICFLANTRAADERTPIFDAVREANIETIRALLAKGADVNARHKEGFIALYWAVTSRSSTAAEMARVLVASAADVNAKDA
jgi:ankyrin repeat protein